MCNNYASHMPANKIAEAFSETAFPLRFDGGAIPNLQPGDDIRIGDVAPIVTWSDDGPLLQQMKWAWKSPQGRPVFNFRSDGRNFENSERCLSPADAFYEFTDAEPGQKRKTKWAFTMKGRDWFWIAGIVKDGAWAMLTTEPGPDIAPYHDRQIVLLDVAGGPDWLTLEKPQGISTAIVSGHAFGNEGVPVAVVAKVREGWKAHRMLDHLVWGERAFHKVPSDGSALRTKINIQKIAIHWCSLHVRTRMIDGHIEGHFDGL